VRVVPLLYIPPLPRYLHDRLAPRPQQLPESLRVLAPRKPTRQPHDRDPLVPLALRFERFDARFQGFDADQRIGLPLQHRHLSGPRAPSGWPPAGRRAPPRWRLSECPAASARTDRPGAALPRPDRAAPSRNWPAHARSGGRTRG